MPAVRESSSPGSRRTVTYGPATGSMHYQAAQQLVMKGCKVNETSRREQDFGAFCDFEINLNHSF